MMLANGRTAMAGLAAIATLATGCGEDDGGDPAGDACVTNGQIVIRDDTNYTFSSTMTPQSTVVKDATDLTFDWSALTQDFYGRPINPTSDLDLILVSLWGMTEAELAAIMNADQLKLSGNKGALTFYPTEAGTPAPTSVRLLELNSFRNEVPVEQIWQRFDTSTPGYQYPPATHTFMLMAQTGTDPGKDARMLGFFRLDPTSTNTTVALTNNSNALTYEVHLTGSPQIGVPAATPGLTIDWTNMTTNALGNPYEVTQITEAVVAHYPTYTLADIEQRFVYLEEEAGAWYSGEVLAGTTMDLSTLTDAAGAPFPGIDATGVWLVALFCTNNCNNPAPWSITLLKPCP